MTTSAACSEPRQALVETMRRLAALGLNRGTAGNASVRTADGFLVTPSGVKPEALDAAAMVALAADGRAMEPAARPSSEWRFHRDIYAARDDVAAIVHVHSSHAAALSCLGQGIPAFHYMVARAGGADIRCAPYATFGTQALSDAAVAALAERRACLLANHGQIAVGGSLAEAVDLAVEVEELAHQYLLARQGGEPVLLSAVEMDIVIEKFKHYGARYGEE
ncbi:MAG: class II aldolase/adducin family protein [Gammaproteobacteria bacterium]|nr:class II aldolase/adducin family protein [Gammaproteobacteria bacterium]